MNPLDETAESKERLFNIEKLATVGMIARGVCHDMNNKFAAIQTTVQTILLYQKALDPELREGLELIQEATRQCGDLIRKFFSYSSRITEVESKGPINFQEIVDCVVSLLKYRLDEWGIKVETDFDARASFRAYPDEFIHLFMHLILNAVDSIRKKDGAGGKIQIRTHENETEFIVEIKDNGKGIPGPFLSKIFEPFAATSEGRGGLDLSIVQRIVRKYDGEIKVQSTAGDGSEFTILLPKRPGSHITTYNRSI